MLTIHVAGESESQRDYESLNTSPSIFSLHKTHPLAFLLRYPMLVSRAWVHSHIAGHESMFNSSKWSILCTQLECNRLFTSNSMFFSGFNIPLKNQTLILIIFVNVSFRHCKCLRKVVKKLNLIKFRGSSEYQTLFFLLNL